MESGEDPAPKTEFLRDLSQSIISYNDSPDIMSRPASTPTAAVKHGCSYCYARPFHEYLGSPPAWISRLKSW